MKYFFILGKRNKDAWIRQLFFPDSSGQAVYVFKGALAGGHLVLTEEFLSYIRPEDMSE